MPSAFGMLQPARRFSCRWQQEREWSRGIGLEQPELPRVQTHVMSDLMQIAAYQCEVMIATRGANAPQSIERRRIADMAAECVARIRRIGDQAAAAHDLGRAANQPQLRVLAMQLEVCGSRSA